MHSITEESQYNARSLPNGLEYLEKFVHLKRYFTSFVVTKGTIYPNTELYVAFMVLNDILIKYASVGLHY